MILDKLYIQNTVLLEPAGFSLFLKKVKFCIDLMTAVTPKTATRVIETPIRVTYFRNCVTMRIPGF